MTEGLSSHDLVKRSYPGRSIAERLHALWILGRSRWLHWFRYGRVVSELHALFLTARIQFRGVFAASQTNGASLLDWATALRRTRQPRLRSYIEANLRRINSQAIHLWGDNQVGWARLADELDNPKLVKSIVLKSPTSAGEKGVLYVSFEVNWIRLMKYNDLRSLLAEFHLVGASSSSPPDYATLFALSGRGHDPAFIQISNPRDAEWMRICSPWILPVPILASDWLNPDWYTPKEHRSRSIDLLMVAAWARVKAHWVLFEALRRANSQLRTVLIGQDMDGRTADDVWREAKAAGVAHQIEIIRDATPKQVTQYQCDSRVNLALSTREGSGVVVVESLLADAPVVMMKGAHIGSARYINEFTGRFSTPKSLARDLVDVVEHSGEYRAREWALEHVTFDRSTKVLNGILKEYTLTNGGSWTRDIVPLCWRPDPIYANPADAGSFQATYDELYRKHGVQFRDYPPSRFLLP